MLWVLELWMQHFKRALLEYLWDGPQLETHMVITVMMV